MSAGTSTSHPLPALLSVSEIGERLKLIFPESFPDRRDLVSQMAARVIFVFLYGGFIEGHGRYLRPSNVYLFTEEQAQCTADDARREWLKQANRPGYRPKGMRWYADNSRESIRDDLIRNQLIRLGISQRLPDVATTSSRPVHYLSAHFAELFDPSLLADQFADLSRAWVVAHLDAATLQRMALKAQGIQPKKGDVLIDLPDGTRIRVSAGPSSRIAKGLVEEFAVKHLKHPALLWLSASDKKADPQYVQRSEIVGLRFDVGAELPDVILADMKQPIRFLFCEIVATDGAVTEARKQALLSIIRQSQIPETNVDFLSAFEDRQAPPFRKNFSRLALDSLVWFRTEPNLLVILSTATRDALMVDPNVELT